MKRAWQEALFRLWPVRFLLALLFVARGACYRLLGKPYRALNDFCWVARVSRSGWPEALARRAIFRIVRIAQSSPHNPVVAAFRADPASDAVAGLYAQSGRGPRDLFRDVIVLKAATDDEKGVILLKYARTFSALAALYDLERLMRRYVFVLEPCWAGYCDPSTLMYLAPAQPVLIMCFTAEDLAFIESIGAPFVPLAMGPADWVNADVFKPPATIEKRYDLVMVANWARHKRHAQLFAALANVRERDVRVLLIGFPWGARTADDIRAEAAAMRNPRVELTIFESLPHTRVAELVAASKVFVFLSRKEGDNKALVEAMFADVPAIVFAESIGGARSRINPATGMLAQDSELADAIRHMLDHTAEFGPRAWALEHTGSGIATRRVNAALRTTLEKSGAPYTRDIVEKTNAPNLAYRHPADREQFAADYEFVRSCALRPVDTVLQVPTTRAGEAN